MGKSELITKVLVPVLAAIFSGIGVVLITPDWEEQARNKGWISQSEWSAAARREGWIPKKECPAYPIKMEIFAPGDGATLDNIHYSGRETEVFHEVLVRLNRPIVGNTDIGFIYHIEGGNDYFIDLPNVEKMRSNTVIANKYFFTVPVKIEPGSKLSMWAFLSEDGSLVESRFSSIEQILKLPEISYVSKSITVSIKPN